MVDIRSMMGLGAQEMEPESGVVEQLMSLLEGFANRPQLSPDHPARAFGLGGMGAATVRQLAEEEKARQEEESSASVEALKRLISQSSSADEDSFVSIGNEGIQRGGGGSVSGGSFSRSNESIGKRVQREDRLEAAKEARKLQQITSGEGEERARFEQQLESADIDPQTKNLLKLFGGDAEKVASILKLDTVRDDLIGAKLGRDKRRLQDILTKELGGSDVARRGTIVDAFNPLSYFDKTGASMGLWGVDESNLRPDLRSKLKQGGLGDSVIERLIQLLDTSNTTNVDEVIGDL